MSVATPIGTATLTSISRRFILPSVIDSVYNSNVLFYRLNAMRKKTVRGGTQIEQPIFYTDFASAGAYEGFDLLDTTPQDVIKNAAWAWKNYYVNVTVDGPTMLKNDSPESVANLVRTYFEIARSKMQDQLGVGVFSNGSNTALIDGLQGAVDDGTVLATYGGLGSRTTTNSFWRPDTGAYDTTTAVLTDSALQSVFQAATEGSRHPTIGVTTDANYNRLRALYQPQQRFPAQPSGQDEQLAKAGFTNILFNNIAVVTDSHCPANNFFFLNEEYIELVVHPGRDMFLGEFQRPVNQDAYVAPLFWMGNMIMVNILRQGRLTALAA